MCKIVEPSKSRGERVACKSVILFLRRASEISEKEVMKDREKGSILEEYFRGQE